MTTTTRAVSRTLAGLLLLAGGGVPYLGAQEAPPAAYQSFVLGVGDIVQVSVWKSPELGVTVPVRPDGRISVPLVGDVDVAGRTPDEVRTTLTQAYERFVTAPAVSLVVQQINSRKLFIIGEVNNSGVYDVLLPTTLMQALAMAGGLTDYARKDEVVVLRSGGEKEEYLTVSIKAIQTGRRLADNILLLPGDTVIVP